MFIYAAALYAFLRSDLWWMAFQRMVDIHRCPTACFNPEKHAGNHTTTVVLWPHLLEGVVFSGGTAILVLPNAAGSIIFAAKHVYNPVWLSFQLKAGSKGTFQPPIFSTPPPFVCLNKFMPRQNIFSSFG